MLPSTLQRLREEPQLSPEGRQQQFTLLSETAQERDRLRQDLSYALDTIKALQAQLEEYDFLLMQAQAQLARRKEVTDRWQGGPSRKPRVDVNPHQAWIEDTWLCSTHNAELLGAAEEEWKEGRPQRALNAAFGVLTSSETVDVVDQLNCRLFIASVFTCSEKYDDSEEHLNMVLEAVQDRHFPNPTVARHIGGIARFLQGKNLIARGQWQAAYWALCRALHTPGYHEKARSLHVEAIDKCVLEENIMSRPPSSRSIASSAGRTETTTILASIQVPADPCSGSDHISGT